MIVAPLLLLASGIGAPHNAQALYNSLDPKSVAESLAFYELYPSSEEGKNALLRASDLLKIPSANTILPLLPQINRLKGEGMAELTEEQIALIENMAAHLPNRLLKGYGAKTEEEVILLEAEEIDLGKALILSQMGGSENALLQARRYSAMLDLMALQILARLPPSATAHDKICQTSWFIFDHMHFKFPPQSVYTENIDRYTFLPSVMDNHLGVCLGVTALYLAIAQRIDLPLEIVTPTGHIYVRYRDGKKTINIETTARGINMPDDTYLSLQSPTLPERSLKEVIGMTHVNQASTYLYKAEYGKAAAAYEKAKPYMPNDPLVRELLGYSYLFIENERGVELLKGLGKEALHTIAEDYLAGKVDLEGIEAAFMLVDEKRESLLAKQRRLEKILEHYPNFREGLLQLAVTWVQLNRSKEAIHALMRAFSLDDSDAVIAYYLSVLHGQRQDFKSCWFFLKKAEEIVSKKKIFPKALKQLRVALSSHCPE